MTPRLEQALRYAALGHRDQVRRTGELPYLEHVIESFGSDRAMYGSDWPASSFAHEYVDWVELVDAVMSGASADEKRQLYRDTAIRVLRLAE